MAMGTRKQRERQNELWIATQDVVRTPGNAFYDRLNQILEQRKFDQRVEHLCRNYYRKKRPLQLAAGSADRTRAGSLRYCTNPVAPQNPISTYPSTWNTRIDAIASDRPIPNGSSTVTATNW